MQYIPASCRWAATLFKRLPCVSLSAEEKGSLTIKLAK